MTTEPDARGSIRRTVAAYVRRLIRVGIAAQTLSSSGNSSLSINRLVGSAVLIASQLQRAIVVRVVGAPLVRRKPRRRPGESAEEYPGPSALPSMEPYAQREEGTEWEEVAPTSAALAEMETQPFTLARMLPSVILAQQTAFRPLASVRSAVSDAVGNLGLSSAARPESSLTGFGTLTDGSRDQSVIGAGSTATQARAEAFAGELRDSPTSTSFAASAPRDPTTVGSAGTTDVSNVLPRASPSSTSTEPVTRPTTTISPSRPSPSDDRLGQSQVAGTSGSAATSRGPDTRRESTAGGTPGTTGVATTPTRPSPSNTSVEPQPDTPTPGIGVAAALTRSSPSKTSEELQSSTSTPRVGVASPSVSQGGHTQFSPSEQRQSPSNTSVEEPSPTSAPYSPQEGTPAVAGAAVSALGVVAAFRATASSMVFDLNNAAQQMTNITLGPQALGASFSLPASRSSVGGTSFQPLSQTTSPQAPMATSGAGPAGTTFASSSSSARGLGLAPNVQAIREPTLKAGTGAPSAAASRPLSPNAGLAAPQASTGQAGVPASSVLPSGLPVIREAPSPARLGAQVNAEPILGMLSTTTSASSPVPVAGPIEETYAPAGLGSVFSTPAVQRATQLSLEVSTLASPTGSAALPLGGGSAAGLGTGAATTVGPRPGAAAFAGAAFSLSTIVGSLGLGGREPAPPKSISNNQLFDRASLAAVIAPAEGSSESSSVVEPLVATGEAQNPLVLSEEGEGGTLTASETATSETRTIGPQRGVSSIQRGPGFNPEGVLFGERWMASIASVTSFGGSLLDALTFPAQAVFPRGVVATSEGRSTAFLSPRSVAPATQATQWSAGEALSRTDTTSLPHEGPAEQGRSGLGEVQIRDGAGPAGTSQSIRAGVSPPYLANDLQVLGTPIERTALAHEVPTTSPRSIWQTATLLPGLLSPWLSLSSGQEHPSYGAPEAGPVEAAHAASLRIQTEGPSLTRGSFALAAAESVRRVVLGASAGSLGARVVGNLAPGTTFVAGRPMGAGAPSPVSGTASSSPAVGSFQSVGSDLSTSSTETAAREGFGPSHALHLESVRFPSIQAALSSVARLGASLAVPNAAAAFPTETQSREARIETNLAEIPGRAIPSGPTLPIGVGTRLGQTAGTPSNTTEPSLTEAGSTEFFGLEAVTRALSIASQLPSSQLGGIAFVPRRTTSTPATTTSQRPQAKRGAPVQVEFAAETRPDVSERWRATPEEAISDVLSDASGDRGSPRAQSVDEPDDRELRKKIEKMIDEELRRYGYQP